MTSGRSVLPVEPRAGVVSQAEHLELCLSQKNGSQLPASRLLHQRLGVCPMSKWPGTLLKDQRSWMTVCWSSEPNLFLPHDYDGRENGCLPPELSMLRSDQIRSVAQSCLTFCDPMNRSMPGLPVHHQLPEFTQTHIHWISDAIQPSHPLLSPSPLAPNPSQHQSLFQWVNSSHEVAKVLELQL